MIEIEENKLYTVAEVANILRITEETVRRKIRVGEMDYIADGIFSIPGYC